MLETARGAARVLLKSRTAPFSAIVMIMIMMIITIVKDYLGSRPQLVRGALGSLAVAGGIQMKLLPICFCGNRSMAKEVSEDRFAHLSICWRWTPGCPETACRQR